MSKYEWEFATALTHAVRRDDLVMAKLLVERGASLDLRRLVVNDAVARGSLETLRWAIGQGGRAKGWRYDRYHPVHTLLAVRINETPEQVAEQKRFWEDMEREARKAAPGVATGGYKPDFPKPIDEPTILAMLDLLIGAGADLDAPWDNGITMLMWTKSIAVTKRLLAAKASLDVADHAGRTAIHESHSSAKARLLVAAGARINALSEPRPVDETNVRVTPLQRQLVGHYGREPNIIETLLELGADPTIRDGRGRSTLAHCYTRPDFDRMLGFGLDPKERLPDGRSLLLHLVGQGGLPRQPHSLALIDRLLALGLGINDVDKEGQTMLHLLADKELAKPEDVRLLVERGADKGMRDAKGRRAFDLARVSDTELRGALR